MALRGNLEDFGLANVFQIIGHTSKTGTLVMRDRDEEIKLYFHTGGVVRCEITRRQRFDLLGTMLRRADAISEAQLAAALEAQKTNRKQVGDCLIAAGAITQADLQEFARLQTSERVFRGFLWREGTYEFTATAPPVPSHPPLKAEFLLMEGFRQMDEWPAIRKRLTSYATTFAILQNLDELLANAAASDVDGIGTFATEENTSPSQDSLDDFNLESTNATGSSSSPLELIEHEERLVYSLIQPDRDIQKLIDLSRLGEFRTCRALIHLLQAGLIALKPVQTPVASAEATVGGISERRVSRRLGPRLSVRSLTQLCTMLGVWGGFVFIGSSGLSPFAPVAQRPAQFLDLALERALGRGEMTRLHGALAVYRALHGTYPDALEDLVQAGLLPTAGLGMIWHERYAYARGEESYTLLSPLH